MFLLIDLIELPPLRLRTRPANSSSAPEATATGPPGLRGYRFRAGQPPTIFIDINAQKTCVSYGRFLLSYVQ